MNSKPQLKEWLVEALEALGGKSSIVGICKYVWEHHEDDLKNSGELFYTWQYDIRWTAQKLRDKGKLRYVKSNKSIWGLTTMLLTNIR